MGPVLGKVIDPLTDQLPVIAQGDGLSFKRYAAVSVFQPEQTVHEAVLALACQAGDPQDLSLPH